jgi:hypothetical protein
MFERIWNAAESSSGLADYPNERFIALKIRSNKS